MATGGRWRKSEDPTDGTALYEPLDESAKLLSGGKTTKTTPNVLCQEYLAAQAQRSVAGSGPVAGSNAPLGFGPWRPSSKLLDQYLELKDDSWRVKVYKELFEEFAEVTNLSNAGAIDKGLTRASFDRLAKRHCTAFGDYRKRDVLWRQMAYVDGTTVTSLQFVLVMLALDPATRQADFGGLEGFAMEQVQILQYAEDPRKDAQDIDWSESHVPTLNRLKQIFRFFDEKRRGLLTQEDLSNVLRTIAFYKSEDESLRAVAKDTGTRAPCTVYEDEEERVDYLSLINAQPQSIRSALAAQKSTRDKRLTSAWNHLSRENIAARLAQWSEMSPINKQATDLFYSDCDLVSDFSGSDQESGTQLRFGEVVTHGARASPGSSSIRSAVDTGFHPASDSSDLSSISTAVVMRLMQHGPTRVADIPPLSYRPLPFDQTEDDIEEFLSLSCPISPVVSGRPARPLISPDADLLREFSPKGWISPEGRYHSASISSVNLSSQAPWSLSSVQTSVAPNSKVTSPSQLSHSRPSKTSASTVEALEPKFEESPKLLGHDVHMTPLKTEHPVDFSRGCLSRFKLRFRGHAFHEAVRLFEDRYDRTAKLLVDRWRGRFGFLAFICEVACNAIADTDKLYRLEQSVSQQELLFRRRHELDCLSPSRIDEFFWPLRGDMPCLSPSGAVSFPRMAVASPIGTMQPFDAASPSRLALPTELAKPQQSPSSNLREEYHAGDQKPSSRQEPQSQPALRTEADHLTQLCPDHHRYQGSEDSDLSFGTEPQITMVADAKVSIFSPGPRLTEVNTPRSESKPMLGIPVNWEVTATPPMPQIEDVQVASPVRRVVNSPHHKAAAVIHEGNNDLNAGAHVEVMFMRSPQLRFMVGQSDSDENHDDTTTWIALKDEIMRHKGILRNVSSGMSCTGVTPSNTLVFALADAVLGGNVDEWIKHPCLPVCCAYFLELRKSERWIHTIGEDQDVTVLPLLGLRSESGERLRRIGVVSDENKIVLPSSGCLLFSGYASAMQTDLDAVRGFLLALCLRLLVPRRVILLRCASMFARLSKTYLKTSARDRDTSIMKPLLDSWMSLPYAAWQQGATSAIDGRVFLSPYPVGQMSSRQDGLTTVQIEDLTLETVKIGRDTWRKSEGLSGILRQLMGASADAFKEKRTDDQTSRIRKALRYGFRAEKAVNINSGEYNVVVSNM